MAAVDTGEQHIKLGYSGATATAAMAVDSYAKAHPPPADATKAPVALEVVAAAAGASGVAIPGAAVPAPRKTQTIKWTDFKVSWEAVKPEKHYAANPKWPRSRPINTKGFAAGCGIRGHLLNGLHKACRAADLTTSGGTAIVVLNEPRVEARVAAGFPSFLLMAW